jgi:hypothetical protein
MRISMPPKAFGFMLLASWSASAGTVALNFSLADNTGNYFDGVGVRTAGWGFTPNADILVTALGVYDPTGNGTGTSHDVGIWTLGGGSLVTSMTISGGVQTGAFRFLTLSTPVALSAGNEYVIGSTTNQNGEGWTWTPVGYGAGVAASKVTYDTADFTFDASGNFWFCCNGGALTYPVNRDNSRPQFFGPNFEFESTVPEPATAALIPLGLGVLAIARTRGRRRANRQRDV